MTAFSLRQLDSERVKLESDFKFRITLFKFWICIFDSDVTDLRMYWISVFLLRILDFQNLDQTKNISFGHEPHY